MTQLFAVIRHGPTEWNEAGRIQGRTDIPLSDQGRKIIQKQTLPSEFSRANWLTSPLIRAKETAHLLGIENANVDDRLIETNWGDWEGKTLAYLRTKYGKEMLINESKGLDLLPPNGESPRQVADRLSPLLSEIGSGRKGKMVAAITHKGVIRSLLALSTRWDMLGKAPIKLDWRAAHIFSIDNNGIAKPHRVNVTLKEKGCL